MENINIIELLPIGEENAISSSMLVSMLGLKNKRQLVKLVSAERRQGGVICSTGVNGGGYYLPKNNDEIRKFCKTLEKRGAHTLGALRSAKKKLNETEGQEELDNYIDV